MKGNGGRRGEGGEGREEGGGEGRRGDLLIAMGSIGCILCKFYCGYEAFISSVEFQCCSTN